MKFSDQIIKWGKLKPFFDKTYSFNTIDIETIDTYYKNGIVFEIKDRERFYNDEDYRLSLINRHKLTKITDMFMLGYSENGVHKTFLTNPFDNLHNFLLKCVQANKDILTWTRYDNTHLLKLILQQASQKDINDILRKIGKITPIYSYDFLGFTFTIVNIIKDSIIFKIQDSHGFSKSVTIYNLKNLFDTDLLTTAKNYGFDYYSKLNKEFHIIDKKRFYNDCEYKAGVIESNRLDNIILIDIANRMLSDFKQISGYYPKSIFTNGSLARSYMLAQLGEIGSKDLNFNVKFKKGSLKTNLLDYSMRSYHGGKIESYILGYVPSAKIIDITSAYPYVMSFLPKLTGNIVYNKGIVDLDKYYYAFLNCEIDINDKELIHPVIVENPINKSNISPYGYFNAVITKIEYEYLLRKGALIKVIDYYAVESDNTKYPYKEIIHTLFEKRLENKKSNPSLSQMYKIILNSLYGISYELTDMYIDIDNEIEWIGYRAGDFFNPIIASYITAYTRTYLSDVSHNIKLNGGEIYLNMTDSIIFNGNVSLDVFSDKKILGKFEQAEIIKDVYILGAGRYEYQNEFTKKFTIKSRGFSVSVKDKSFYSELDLSEKMSLAHRTFVTSFKASTKKYEFEKMGYLVDDTYNIDPFNLGGKRIIENYNVNLNKEFTKTHPIYLEKGIIS